MSNQIDNVCDICLGKKITLAGKPCICTDGTLLGLLAGLRIELYSMGAELAEIKDGAKGSDTYYRDYVQNPYGFGGHRQ